MADDFDLGQLSPSQQEVLQQFTDVTGQEIQDAIPVLERSQWNVQIAISKFFDGEPDPVEPLDVPRAAARHETLQESLASSGSGRRPRKSRTDVAPRVVPQPPVTYRPHYFVSLLLTPFQLGFRVAATLLRSVLYLLAFLPRPMRPRTITSSIEKGWKGGNGRRMLMPRDAAARFRREFEEEYGQHGLPFFDGGHALALDTAKRELKFLLIVLVSPEHDDTEAFLRDTLLAPEVVAFVGDAANNLLLWGGNVLDTEAYQVSMEYSCTRFPFSALVCLTPREGGGSSSTRMGIVKRLAGPTTPAEYVAGLQAAMAKYAPDLDGARAERAANEVARSLRSEQDSAYERSLARDRERARQRREAAAAKEEAERAAREAEEQRHRQELQRQQWRAWRATKISPEPEAGGKNAVRLALNLPESAGASGRRVVRRFDGAAPLEELYAFVECYELVGQAQSEQPERPDGYRHQYGFRIASVMPRETLEPSESVTIGEALGRGGNLIVEEGGEE